MTASEKAMTIESDKLIADLMQCLPDPSAAIDPDQHLLATGVLDSLSFIDFTAAVEDRFGVTLPDGVVFGDRFNTLSQVAAAVRSLRGTA